MSAFVSEDKQVLQWGQAGLPQTNRNAENSFNIILLEIV